MEGPRRGATNGVMLGMVETRAGVAPLGMSAVIVGELDGEAVGEPDSRAVRSALKDGIGDGATVGVAEVLLEGVQVPSTLTCIAVVEPSCVAYTTTSPLDKMAKSAVAGATPHWDSMYSTKLLLLLLPTDLAFMNPTQLAA